jgi:predicted histidine transporter YuiF (NhaC family)
MTGSRKFLVLGGMTLAALGMLYGLYYAIFVEHQTLDQMGGSLAQAFASAAKRNLPQSQTALQSYTAAKYDYVRQVDAHSHWIGLGMLMIVLGVLFGRVNFTETVRQAIAISLLAGSTVFPLAVILQTYHHGALVFKALAVVGPGLVIFGLAATAWGFARQRAST